MTFGKGESDGVYTLKGELRSSECKL